MRFLTLSILLTVAMCSTSVAQNGFLESGYTVTPVGDPASKTCYTYATAFSTDEGTVYISSIFCYEDNQCPSLRSWALNQFNSRVADFSGTFADVQCTEVATGVAPLSKDAVIDLQNGKVVYYRKTQGKKVIMVQFPQCK